MIVGQNSLLNQYVPTFYIKDLVDGQYLKYDSNRKAFFNTTIAPGSGGVSDLGQLDNVADSVDSILVPNGQALVYNTLTNLWTNQFVDYDTLLNKPTSADFTFLGLSDTATPSLPSGYVRWDATGTQLVYSTTIPATSITGLALVATTGNYNDLTNKPTGFIKAVTATLSLAVAGSFNIGAILPAGSTVLKVKVNVTAADTGTGNLSIGIIGNVAAYMTTTQNDTQTVGIYISEIAVPNTGAQVIGTVGGVPAGAGSATVYVEYLSA